MLFNPRVFLKLEHNDEDGDSCWIRSKVRLVAVALTAVSCVKIAAADSGLSLRIEPMNQRWEQQQQPALIYDKLAIVVIERKPDQLERRGTNLFAAILAGWPAHGTGLRLCNRSYLLPDDWPDERTLAGWPAAAESILLLLRRSSIRARL